MPRIYYYCEKHYEHFDECNIRHIRELTDNTCVCEYRRCTMRGRCMILLRVD